MKIRIELLTNEDEPIGRKTEAANFSYFVGMVAFESIVDKLTADMHPDEGVSDAEKSRRCTEAYSLARTKNPRAAYVPCVVDGKRYSLCIHCPLRVEEP